MMVTLVSQCEKRAINNTRRVLDSFASRIGVRTWQTVITENGLQAVKKLLRKTASKNTAVSCHRIRSRNRSELEWIVGKLNKFNAQGIVPVNFTNSDMLSQYQDDTWHGTEIIATLSSIAGLFHDFGKANQLFQNKLNPKKTTKGYESFRHEWVSLRLFQAFVGNKKDKDWLELLQTVNKKTEADMLSLLVKDSLDTPNYPLANLPKVAKIVAWLIVSHHKLPCQKDESKQPELKDADKWLHSSFDSSWNSTGSKGDDKTTLKNNWKLPHGTPFLSKTWRIKANQIAKKALTCQGLLDNDLFNNRFIMHVSRMVLMLSDHYYSSLQPTKKWQDNDYKSFANTWRNKGTNKRELKQKLDEHNIGVATNSYLFARRLPKLIGKLPNLGYDKKFTKNTKLARFLWQNNAYKLAKSISTKTNDYGFFGINMSSTGLGKTLANFRIMYGLSDDNKRYRFNIAVGLRTLTLQTGDALCEKLKLDKTEIAVLIGSDAVKKLYDKNKQDGVSKQHAQAGSESLDVLMPEDSYVQYEGAVDNNILSRWLSKKNQKLQKMINAPVLVSTIDYLTPATEGARGGKQIAPMLRLLSSDLVLDEPDDFGLEDLPALCRLVNWAGVLGSRVLLSTATMPPALAYALFEAYQAGRKDYTAVNGNVGETNKICCAWFDEFNCTNDVIDNIEQFKTKHTKFVDKRVAKLKTAEQILSKAKLIDVDCKSDDVIDYMAKITQENIHKLHGNHHQTNPSSKKVSVGLVRMANINPLVAVAKQLFLIKPKDNYRIHYCVYHSQFPLAIRSHIENRLDKTLNRYCEEDIWQLDETKQALVKYPEQNHIFVVLATSVAEVGRDHDYDWAIAEPSSMRSLIQLAGRIQRHRKKEPTTENLFIFTKNIKALKNISPAYCTPGFEDSTNLLADKNLKQVLPLESYQYINAIPRIEKPNISKGDIIVASDKRQYKYFVHLEHIALYRRLLGELKEENNAKMWWDKNITWCAQLQYLQQFRSSKPDVTYCLYFQENDDKEPIWTIKDTTSFPATYPGTAIIKEVGIKITEGNQAWFNLDTDTIYTSLASRLDKNKKYVSKVFGEIKLLDKNYWKYNKILGAHYEN